MITKQDIQEAIAECQGVHNPNANTCIKLAAFYTIYDHMFNTSDREEHSEGYRPEPSQVSYSSGLVSFNNDSEFAQLINGKDMQEVLSTVNELMDTLQVINPRLYEGVINKLKR